MIDLLKNLERTAVVAVLRAPDADRALRAVDALVTGGVTGIEITYTTPDAPAVIAEVARRYGDGVLLGAGTLRTAQQAQDAVEAGATFLVSPGSIADLARSMLATGAGVLLGAMTPTEVMTATALGTHAVKLFPASLGGPAFLKALRGPFPELPFVPTGGVSAGNIHEWLQAGALAVGAGGELCSAGDLRADRFDAITDKARAFMAAVQRWRFDQSRS